MQHHRITHLSTQLLRVSLLSISLATSAIAQPAPVCINHAPNIVNCPANINIPSNTPPGTVLARCTAQFNMVCPKDQSISIAKPGVREDYSGDDLNMFVTKHPGVMMRISNISVNRPQRGQWPAYDNRYESILYNFTRQGMRQNIYEPVWFKGLTDFAAVDNAALQGQIEIELVRGEHMKRLDKDTAYGWNNVSRKYDLNFEASQLGGLIMGARNLLDVAFYLTRNSFIASAQPGPNNHKANVPYYAIPYYFQTTITEAVACTVTRPVINVDMGKISMGDLNNAPGPEVPFQMGFNCPGGAHVALTLTDAANPSNLTDTLTLSGSPTAQGVGIQIKNSNGGIITFAQAAAAQVTVPLTGDASIPFTARYKKNGPITPGKGNAQMTVNVAYQ